MHSRPPFIVARNRGKETVFLSGLPALQNTRLAHFWLIFYIILTRVRSGGSQMDSKLTAAFNDFRINFSEFHRDITAFVEQLPSYFKPGAPETLKFVSKIPSYLSPKDTDFTVDNAQAVMEKWNYIYNVTKAVLDKMPQFLKTRDWFDGQKTKFIFWSTLVNNSANFVKSELPKSYQVIGVSAGGIGGVNSGVEIPNIEMKRTQISLRELMKTLN